MYRSSRHQPVLGSRELIRYRYNVLRAKEGRRVRQGNGSNDKEERNSLDNFVLSLKGQDRVRSESRHRAIAQRLWGCGGEVCLHESHNLRAREKAKKRSSHIQRDQRGNVSCRKIGPLLLQRSREYAYGRRASCRLEQARTRKIRSVVGFASAMEGSGQLTTAFPPSLKFDPWSICSRAARSSREAEPGVESRRAKARARERPSLLLMARSSELA